MTSPYIRQAIYGASYALHDSRAVVYEKQPRLKGALRDAKKIIDITPSGMAIFARLASLPISTNLQSSATLRMCSLALGHLGEDANHGGRQA